MRKALVSISSTSIAMRECLIGIFEHINSGHPMDIQLLADPTGSTSRGITPQTVRAAVDGCVNGVITGIGVRTPGFERLIDSGLAVVLNNKPPHWKLPADRPISFVHSDDIAVGRLGARYLTGLGKFRSYAFIPCEERNFWSILRRRGFELELARHKIRPCVFRHKNKNLSSWLDELPKPTAVFAANDMMARTALEACRQLKLKVPVQVTVLGVDNDEIICNSCRPTLSSIHPGNVELGRRCASELMRLMRSGATGTTIKIAPLAVVERQSTRAIPPAGCLIDMALEYIDRNLASDIDVSAVARHLHVSESLLRLRFRTILGKSVISSIIERRLDRAKTLLAESDDSIRTIAQKTGFSSACRLTHCFGKRLGQTPSEWRTNHNSREQSPAN